MREPSDTMTEQEWRENFARAVLARRIEKNMSQKELAEKANITECTMSRYMKCNRTPRADAIIRIAKTLECSTDDLIMFSKHVELED